MLRLRMNQKNLDITQIRVLVVLYLSDDGWSVTPGNNDYASLDPCDLEFEYLFTNKVDSVGFNYVSIHPDNKQAPELDIKDIERLYDAGHILIPIEGKELP